MINYVVLAMSLIFGSQNKEQIYYILVNKQVFILKKKSKQLSRVNLLAYT